MTSHKNKETWKLPSDVKKILRRSEQVKDDEDVAVSQFSRRVMTWLFTPSLFTLSLFSIDMCVVYASPASASSMHGLSVNQNLA